MTTYANDKDYLKSLTILYVEDEEDIFNSGVRLLSKYSSTLLTARNGREGLEFFQAHSPDIIITDIKMPIMDGLTMIGEIRKINWFVPIILLTAFENTDYLMRAIDANVDKYLTKPTDVTRLIECITNCAHNLRIERELKESEERLRQMFHGSADGHFLLCDGIVTDCNRAAEKMTGCDRLQICGQKPETFMPHFQPDGRLSSELFSERLTGVVQSGESRFDIQCERPDGSHYWCSVSLSITTMAGKPVTICDVRDISARKSAEEKLASITASTSDAVIMIGSMGEIMVWNPAACAMFGYDEAEASGKNLHELLAPTRYHADHRAAFQLFRHTGRGNAVNKTVELSALRKGGEEFPIELTLSAHQQGVEWNAIGIIRDISARKQIEQEKQLLLEEQKIILENAGVGISFVKNRKRKWVNSTFCTMFGYSAEEMSDVSTSLIYPSQEDYEQLGVEAYAVLATGKTIVKYQQVRRRDGSHFTARMTGKAVNAEHPQDGSIWIFADVTIQKKLEDEIQKSYTLLKDLSHNIPGMIYQYQQFPNGHSCFPYVSDAIFDLFHRGPDQLRENASLFFALIHPDDLGWFVAEIEKSSQMLSVFDHECRFVVDGVVRWFRSVASPKRHQDGSTIWHGFINDTSDIVTMNILLRDATEAANTLDGLSSAICVIDASGAIKKTNQAWEQLLVGTNGNRELCGVGANYFLIYGSVITVENTSVLELKAGIHLVLEGSLPEYILDFQATIHGVERWISCKVTSFTAGGVKYAVIAHIDISRRKGTELELLKLSSAIIQSPVSVIITDQNGCIEYINPYLTTLTGFTLSELKGQNPRILNSGSTPRETYQELWSTITSGNTWDGEIVNKRKDGTLYTEQAKISPIRNSLGRITNYVAIKEDITKRKMMEAALCQAKDLAEAGSRAKSEFLATISHEMRTPLNGVFGMIQILLDTELSSDQREFAETARKCSDHLLDIINDIFDYSDIQKFKLNITVVDFDFKKVITDTIHLQNKFAQEKGLTIAGYISPDVPAYLKGDPKRLCQVLTNLLNNAIKFSHQGEILLSVRVNLDQYGVVVLHFEVKDSGIGIPESLQGKIFEPFTQGDGSSTRRYEGTGMGLAISKQIVYLFGGDIGVKSEIGVGSTFWFTAMFEKADNVLACKDGVCDAAISCTPATVIPLLPVSDGNHLESIRTIRILYAEDNFINQEVVLSLLETLGYQIDIVEDGLAAVTALESQEYDLVLMDCLMPIMDGLEATKIIRDPHSNVRNHNVPIIAVTANVLGNDRECCIYAGMDDYLAKPIRKESLLRTIDYWLGKKWFSSVEIDMT